MALVAEHHFVWFDQIVSHCPGMGDGAEGAPVLNAAGKVIALHHRVYGAGVPVAPCFFGSPCEVGGGQPERAEHGRTYAVPLTQLNGCFAENGSFDVTRDACHLEGRDTLKVKDKPSLLMAPGPNKAWGGEVASNTFEEVRIKSGPAADTNCRDANGYSNPVSLDVANLALESLPRPATSPKVCSSSSIRTRPLPRRGSPARAGRAAVLHRARWDRDLPVRGRI